METNPKVCGRCARSFTQAEWAALPLLGVQVFPDEKLELRNCPCGSTLAVPLLVPRI
jgi:hypothetical protein